MTLLIEAKASETGKFKITSKTTNKQLAAIVKWNKNTPIGVAAQRELARRYKEYDAKTNKKKTMKDLYDTIVSRKPVSAELSSRMKHLSPRSIQIAVDKAQKEIDKQHLMKKAAKPLETKLTQQDEYFKAKLAEYEANKQTEIEKIRSEMQQKYDELHSKHEALLASLNKDKEVENITAKGLSPIAKAMKKIKAPFKSDDSKLCHVHVYKRQNVRLGPHDYANILDWYHDSTHDNETNARLRAELLAKDGTPSKLIVPGKKNVLYDPKQM